MNNLSAQSIFEIRKKKINILPGDFVAAHVFRISTHFSFVYLHNRKGEMLARNEKKEKLHWIRAIERARAHKNNFLIDWSLRSPRKESLFVRHKIQFVYFSVEKFQTQIANNNNK